MWPLAIASLLMANVACGNGRSAVSSPGSSATPSAVLAVLHSPHAGTYTIRDTGTSAKVITEKVTADAEGFTLQDRWPNGAASIQTFRVRSDGFFINSEEVAGLGSCTFPHSTVAFPSPLTSGLSWQYSFTCGALIERASARVIGREQISIAGSQVQTIRIDFTVSYTGLTKPATDTKYLDPARGLVLRDEGSTTTALGTSTSIKEFTTLPALVDGSP